MSHLARIPVTKTRLLILASLAALSFSVHAQSRVMVAIDPSDAVSNAVIGIGSFDTMSKALSTKATVTKTHNLSDAMRASRTVENDIIIGPAHVAASAVTHAYKLLATTGNENEYQLVTRRDIDTVGKLRGKHIYLPQQDSLPSYIAKGLLRESALPFKSLGKVTYGRTSGAGLLAVSYGLADATIASSADVADWLRANPNSVNVLSRSRLVPGGMNVLVRKDISPADEDSILKWITSSEGMVSGLGRLKLTSAADRSKFVYVASLGIFTPAELAKVEVVNAERVMELAANGAVIYDTRSPREYAAEHIRGAVMLPYIEKSLKDIDYDASLDDFSAASAVPKERAAIFMCNGPECWKSYKAAKAAVAMGVEKVYWFRGGMPEWREKTMPVVASAPGQTNVAAAKK